ncbi:hypothetical protein KC19_3G130700 [Ceratodon purpureus]|uniref:Uncharacterized protein n=1 Tax=Ceratodon purpureus TaxID=3225 RepID=A0A8T0IHU9_CERPU|nr:hypothetical protein KC19_3G130700 [Ceratodon purpureus]
MKRCKALLWVLHLLIRFLPVWTLRLQNLTLSSSRLNVGDTLISPSGHFELGIFPYPAESGRYYLCVRYAAPIQQVAVWVANREIPLSQQSYLELSSPNGNLQLSDPDNNVAQIPWSSNTADAGVGRAQLLDTGNLVLVDNDGNPIWDSFKNSSITDTLLPGQYFYKIGNINLTSWLTKDDPATGNGTYTFGWGTRANMSGSILQLAWTSPKVFSVWRGGTYIPGPDDTNPHIIPDVDYVYFDATQGNLYFPSTPANIVIISGGDLVSSTTLKRLTLDADGGLRIWQFTVGTSKTWTAEANWVVTERHSQCFTIGTCGPFSLCNMSPFGSLDRVQCTCPYGFKPINPDDLSRGCTPIERLSGSDLCNASKVNLTVLNDIDMPWGGDYRNLTGAESANCQAECLKDCKCAGAVYSKNEQRCWMKMTPLYNLGYPTVTLHGSDRTAFIKISLYQPPSPESDQGKFKLWMIALVVVGGLLGLGLLVACCVYYRRENHITGPGGEPLHPPWRG